VNLIVYVLMSWVKLGDLLDRYLCIAKGLDICKFGGVLSAECCTF
jgi:hypothetical protein